LLIFAVFRCFSLFFAVFLLIFIIFNNILRYARATAGSGSGSGSGRVAVPLNAVFPSPALKIVCVLVFLCHFFTMKMGFFDEISMEIARFLIEVRM
jgi:hypothetical protein